MKIAKTKKAGDKMDVTETNGITTVILKGNEARRWMLPVAILLSVILLIVGAIIGETIRPKPDEHWSVVNNGFNLYATIGGIIGFISPYIYFLNRKQKIVFSDKGLALRRRLYLWEDIKGFDVENHYQLRNGGHSNRIGSAICFEYGVKDISVGIGWSERTLAVQICDELNVIARKYR